MAKSAILSSADDVACKTYKEKTHPKRTEFIFHQLAERFTNLIKIRNMPYAIQVAHNVKFVFHKIRFSSGFNLIDNDRKTFLLFKDRSRFKEAKQELDDQNVTRLISPFDCYHLCTKEPDCSSFSFCKYKTSRFEKMTTKCQLSDHVLGEHYEQIQKDPEFSGLYSARKSVKRFVSGRKSVEDDGEDDPLIEDKNCQTFSVNYLKHFKSKGDSLFATPDSMRSDQVNSKEECAKSCYRFNKGGTNEKCGKLEICLDEERKDGQFQCNLKPFVGKNERQLNNQSCEYYKINNLIDYHQVELNEDRDHLEWNSFQKIDDCAKDCTALNDSCKEFNFCWVKTLEEYDYQEEDGHCLWRVAKRSGSKLQYFNASKEALTCVTMIKNGHIIASELERTLSDDFQTHVYRLKYIKEHNPNELSASAFKLFLFAFGAAGLLLGWLGFSYYEKKISPAYRAEAGSFFPTRRVMRPVKHEDGEEMEIRESEVQVEERENSQDCEQQSTSQNSRDQIYSYQNPNYLSTESGGESTEMKRFDQDEFTDINL